MRVRVVEPPITPYVQWELHGLKLRVECGEHISVISPAAVAPFERDGNPAPEIVILGSLVMYEVLYDKSSVLCGARKIADPEAIKGCRTDVEQLFDRGEDFMSFFEREVALLPPPQVR